MPRLLSASRAASLQARRYFLDPEKSGEIRPISKLGAERPDRYLFRHELARRRAQQVTGETAMKTITSAVVALVLLTGIAGSAQALDARSFYDLVDRNHN